MVSGFHIIQEDLAKPLKIALQPFGHAVHLILRILISLLPVPFSKGGHVDPLSFTRKGGQANQGL